MLTVTYARRGEARDERGERGERIEEVL